MRPPHQSLDAVRRVAADAAAPAAADVDAKARFPREALSSLRSHRLLGVSSDRCDQPAWTMAELAEAASILGSHCAATGMIWAMHHSQQLAVVRHGAQPQWRGILSRLAAGDVLVASATSEGTGAVLTSDAPLGNDDHGQTAVEKRASAVSYGLDADAFLVSCRRSADARQSDVVLAFVWADQADVAVEGAWHSLGMRGTVSVPLTIRARFPPAQVLPEPFEAVYRSTMVPAAHVLWAACWLGIAQAALDRARRRLRRERTAAGSAHIELSEAEGRLGGLRALVSEGAHRFEDLPLCPEVPLAKAVEAAAWFNELKMSASAIATGVGLAALRVLGVAGYLEDGPESVTRNVRDLLSTELMVSNHRLRDHNAALALMRRDS